MAVRDVRLFGDPVLRERATEVTEFDRELRRLVTDLTETLRGQRGSGLAATQIGVLARVFAFDVGGTRGHIVNPVLDFPDEQEQDGPEGCLSIPGLYFDNKRRLHTVATGVDQHGRPVQVVGEAELARCLQHETDHLDGMLFIDRMDTARRKAALRAIREAEWNNLAKPEFKISPHPIAGKLG